jgi:hypothetical protein
VRVAHAFHVTRIGQARAKTDPIDARKLAELLRVRSDCSRGTNGEFEAIVVRGLIRRGDAERFAEADHPGLKGRALVRVRLTPTLGELAEMGGCVGGGGKVGHR